MEDIFERKKSPFYHFGSLMRLRKIPFDDFLQYIVERLKPVLKSESETVGKEILAVTYCHPYYTQQLASQVWELASYEDVRGDVVEMAMTRLTSVHDLDFERLWIGFNRMDKRMMIALCNSQNPLQNRQLPTSTVFSSIKRLMKTGYVIRGESYEVEDPFFKRWILERQN